VKSKNGKEKQRWKDDGGKGKGCKVGWWKGSRQETSSRPKNNVDLILQVEGRLR
jgi:hypothetical protein